MPDPQHPAAIQRVVDAAARKGVTLEIKVFKASTHTAEEAAATVGAEIGQIVKSLVFVVNGPSGSLEPVLCLVSGPNRVEARELTGFVIGGIPPIGHTRPVRVIMDPDLGRYQVVWAAAGTQTAVFPVGPGTLRMLSNANVAPICEERRAAERTSETGEPPAEAGAEPAAETPPDGVGAGGSQVAHDGGA